MASVGVDVGGTFTDLVLERDDDGPGGRRVFVHKVPSTPADQSIGVVAGIRQQLELRLHHFQVGRRAGRLNSAVDGDRLSGMKFAVEVGCVEPDAFQGAIALANGELKERHAARAQQGGSADFSDDAGSFSRLDFVE